MKFPVITTIEAAMKGCIAPDAESDHISRPGATGALDLFNSALESGSNNDLEDAAGLIAGEFESQGFINGFRAGMKLAFEIWGKR